MSCTTPACFSTFFDLATIVPTLLKVPNLLVYLFVNFFDYNYNLKYRVESHSIIITIFVNFFWIIMIIIENVVSMHTASKQWHRAPPEKMLRLMLQCWLCSTRYTAVWINNCLKRTSAIKVATMKITDDFWSHQVRATKLTLFMVHGEQRWMGHKGGHFYEL